MDVKQHSRMNRIFSELRSCVKDEVDVLGSPLLTVRPVSVDVKRQRKRGTMDAEMTTAEFYKAKFK